ncbi:hypothetical protein [Pseudomonas vranovensis]|uniref:hypothetical protein n=1 Tax=Pseudomonas vranovensis TaxID=321661 RepID=UPI00048BBB2F|nr:hypothetical protein [Pseudomonas vranovensis]
MTDKIQLINALLRLNEDQVALRLSNEEIAEKAGNYYANIGSILSAELYPSVLNKNSVHVSTKPGAIHMRVRGTLAKLASTVISVPG